MNLWAVALIVLAVNIPFGFWRSGARKFSVAWFTAIHAPVPLVAALRVYSGIGFQWKTLPLIVAAYVAGQTLGGRLRSFSQTSSGG